MAEQRSTERLVWLLIGPKAGDNAQMRALGGALARTGWRVEERALAFRSWELILHGLPRPTAAAVDKGSRQQLRPPWPDLVITAGRRNELVARWIRDRSGGRCRLVHLGRPWSRPERFDLVVTTPQYALAADERVMVNALPLTAPLEGGPARVWEARLNGLPRPWIGVLVGGDSGAFVFSTALARYLARRLDCFAHGRGGSLLVTTSPRTPPAFSRTLQARLTAPCHFHHWSPGAESNPYRAFLTVSDLLVVTAESVSMIAEASRTGKPLYLAPAAVPGRRPWWLRRSSFGWRPFTHRLAMGLAPRRFSREIGRIHDALIGGGHAAWLGTGDPVPSAPLPDPLGRTAARVRSLFD